MTFFAVQPAKKEQNPIRLCSFLSSKPLFQQAFFFNKIGHHVGCRRRDLDALLAVFRRAEAQAVQGPAARRTEMGFKAVVKLMRVLIYFRQLLFRRVETADQGADNQAGTAQCAADAARTSQSAAQAAGHADGHIGKV